MTTIADVAPAVQAMLAAGDSLVSFREAETVLRVSAETLKSWAVAGVFPALITPTGQWRTFRSFLTAVMNSARPGVPGNMRQVAAEWFAEHGSLPAVTP
jgi:hypothetical protein